MINEKTNVIGIKAWGALYQLLSFLTSGRGSRVVWVSDRGLPCHECDSSTTKDPPCDNRWQHKHRSPARRNGDSKHATHTSPSVPSLAPLIRYKGSSGEKDAIE
ncbi:hypothetical protein TNCV_3176701 [Trichonephila clavipes]|nr:hypothetical protein TNCV_3176701 [Trichonephila clavipes]